MTLEKAFELSIKKWKLIVKNDGLELPDIMYIDLGMDKFHSACAMCEYQKGINKRGDVINDLCKDCGLLIDLVIDCDDYDHPFTEWQDADYKTVKQAAQKVLDLIKQKQKEYLENQNKLL